jgi:hypothetical protein
MSSETRFASPPIWSWPGPTDHRPRSGLLVALIPSDATLSSIPTLRSELQEDDGDQVLEVHSAGWFREGALA